MGLVSIKSKFFAALGILLLIFSVAGLIYVGIEHETYLYSEEYGYTGSIDYTEILEGNHTYEIFVGAREQTDRIDAVVNADYTIFLDGTEYMVGDLWARDSVDDEDETGDASDTDVYNLTLSNDANITVTGLMTSGDYWYVRIYQDVPAELYARLTQPHFYPH